MAAAAGLVERALADAGLAIADVDGLAVSIGPGSFTGLRIGLALAKGIAFAGGLPIARRPDARGAAPGRPMRRPGDDRLRGARRAQAARSTRRSFDADARRGLGAVATRRRSPPAALATRAARRCGRRRRRGRRLSEPGGGRRTCSGRSRPTTRGVASSPARRGASVAAAAAADVGRSSRSTFGRPRRSWRGAADHPGALALTTRFGAYYRTSLLRTREGRANGDRKDEELIQTLLEREPELRRYYEEHVDLERQLASLPGTSST